MSWQKPFTEVLDESNAPFYTWSEAWAWYHETVGRPRASVPTAGTLQVADARMAEGSRLRDVAVSVIAAALLRHGGNVSAAAWEFGASRNTIYRKMQTG